MEEKKDDIRSPDEIAKEFGNFAPPDSFSFPQELQAPTPRGIAERLKHGTYETKWRQTAYAALSLGVTFVGLSFFGFVRELGYYILPLAYLDWIGYGIIGLIVVGFLLRKIKLGPFRYIRFGMPLVCRVLRTQMQLTEGYGIKSVKFSSLVQFKDPQTNQTECATTASPEIGSTHKPEIYSTTVKDGDYVTAVYLPGKLEKSLQIYGYLGLNPDVDFVRKHGERIEEHISRWKVAGLAILVVAALLLIVGFLYALEFLFPIKSDAWFLAVIGIGAFVIGIVAAVVFPRIAKTEEQRTLKHRAATFLVGTILGLLLMLVLVPVVNSVFDRSEGELKPIEVTEFWEETWNFIIRNYKIEYCLVGESKTNKYPATFEHMGRFQQTFFAVIEVKQGALNWPWISHIWPVVFVRLDNHGKLEAVSNEQLEALGDTHDPNEPLPIDLAIMRGRKDFLPVDAGFKHHIIEKLTGDSND